MQTPQQLRAKYALQQVRSAETELEVKEQGNFKSYARNLPFMIHANGLGQAAAFFVSKGGIHRRLYGILSDWLTGDDQVYSDYPDLLEGITQADMASYLTAQAESIQLLEWVRKFSDAFLKDPDDTNKGDATNGKEENAPEPKEADPEGAS